MKCWIFITCLLVASCATKETSWIAIGDSITYLNDHPDETGNRVTKGYLTLVSEKLPTVPYTNKGYNGWTAVRIAREIESLALTKANMYSVFLGTNDWWHGEPLGTLDDYSNNTGDSTFFGAYRIIIDKIHELNKDAKIMLLTPMQRGDFVYINDAKNNAYGSYREKDGQSLEQFANAVITIGKQEGLTIVDIFHDSGITPENAVKYKRLKNPETGDYQNYSYPEYIDIPFDPNTDEYPYPGDAIDMTYDGLHPSDKGNEIIARMVADQIKR